MHEIVVLVTGESRVVVSVLGHKMNVFNTTFLSFLPEFMFSEWKTRLRDERDSEFAPPTEYFTKGKMQKPDKNKTQENKSKTSFKWTKGPGGISESKEEAQSQPKTVASPPQPQQKLPTPTQPQTSSPSDHPADSAPLSAPPFNPQYPPPPFYPPFPPPQFSGPPHLYPQFPPLYPNQYPPHYPPQNPLHYPPQQPPQPAELSQAQQPAQSLDDMLSFYRNSS